MNEIPEMIIVGISYQIAGDFYTKGMQECLDIRARDFLPTYVPLDTIIKPGQKYKYIRYSGGGEDFLNFIEKELIPYIETEYRADPGNRGLFGYSLGGTFTTYSMFSRPGLFKNYFIGSPYLGWDNRAVYKFNNTEQLIGKSDTINVYISSGELEYGGRRHSLTDTLKGLNNPHIILKSELLEGETHLSGIGLAYSRAFRRLYGLK
jgi:predicted alpha/beta superfamily hydrolase